MSPFGLYAERPRGGKRVMAILASSEMRNRKHINAAEGQQRTGSRPSS